MDRGNLMRTGRRAVILLAGASLAACARLTTPTYAIHSGPGAEARHRPAGMAAGAGGMRGAAAARRLAWRAAALATQGFAPPDPIPGGGGIGGGGAGGEGTRGGGPGGAPLRR